jgi:hypothetical protein
VAVITERDLAVIRWIGEQYAVPVEILGELLARLAPADAGTRASRFGQEEPSRAAMVVTRERLARRHVTRLESMDLLQRFRLASGPWVAPTRAGLRRTGLAWEPWDVSDWQLDHLAAVARLRLHLEREYPGAAWESERAIRSRWANKGARVRRPTARSGGLRVKPPGSSASSTSRSSTVTRPWSPTSTLAGLRSGGSPRPARWPAWRPS